jgi:crotonobetainyl-CoA:carnitine CoA-transferase CaiB-like acyl-CoA transferase
MNTALDELLGVRQLAPPTEKIDMQGQDPVLSTRFALGGASAAILAAIGVAVNDLWELRTGRRQDLAIKLSHAAAALRSYNYFSVDAAALHDPAAQGNNSASINWTLQQQRQAISTPHPTRDGRYFLPHVGLPHLAERALGVLGCDYELEAVIKAVAGWDGLALEEAIAAVGGCGAMVRSSAEWLAHPQGQVLAGQPVVEIIKLGDSPPEPLPAAGARPLSGVRVLDLTRILAGPTCARTLAEHGADVLMVTAAHLPQAEMFVRDTSHGKRSCFLDLDKTADQDRLGALLADADVFSQGYRPGVLAQRGLAPEALATIRPGIIYTSMNCYGYAGPMAERAGWEQLAQSVTGIAAEHGAAEQGPGRPTLLPAAACDYSTGYLAAYGTLLALGRRAREGGSYHVRVSLCQSAMFIQRQPRVDYTDTGMDLGQRDLNDILKLTDSAYGKIRHLGPVLRMTETQPRWDLPSPVLGTHEAVWQSR